MESTVIELGAFGFWLFVAACVLGGIWDSARRRESEQETLRRLVESGKELDPDTINRVLNVNGKEKDAAKDLKVAGIIVLAIAPGMLVLGIALSFLSSEALTALIGVAGLMLFIGGGLYYAGYLTEKWRREEQAD